MFSWVLPAPGSFQSSLGVFVDSRGSHDRPWGPQEAVLRASFPPEPHSWTVCKRRAARPKPPRKDTCLQPSTCSFTEPLPKIWWTSWESWGPAGCLPTFSSARSPPLSCPSCSSPELFWHSHIPPRFQSFLPLVRDTASVLEWSLCQMDWVRRAEWKDCLQRV